MVTSEALSPVATFRTSLHSCFGKRADALFELVDTVLTADTVPSFAHLSLEASHRCGWGSLYAALRHGQVDTEALRSLLARYPLDGGQPIYAVDVSVCPRCDAETSPARGYYYHPSRHSNGKPIVAGWAYQWIAQLGVERNSWTAPLDVRRVHPSEDANTAAIEQVRACVSRLRAEEQSIPLFVFDAGYDPVALTLGLEDTHTAILVRLRSNRCFYADPGGYIGNGRPRRHGAKFVCKDAATWPEPPSEHTCDDPGYGKVRVRAWAGLHSVVKIHQTLGSRNPRPIVRGCVVLVEVAKLPGQTRKPRMLWLFWHGPGEPDLSIVWRAYIRRSGTLWVLEHTIRFSKQTLYWTMPRLRWPEQADSWSWLVLAAYTQLRLGRPWVQDKRLPWERRLEANKITPYRVRRAFSSVLSVLGTPANGPKPCGRSPGRPKGCRSGPATLHPVLKKSA